MGPTPPPKEGVLPIFVAPKSPSPSARFEPANLGSNGKHANHYTTKDDSLRPQFISLIKYEIV
jgi:hypothetical protein